MFNFIMAKQFSKIVIPYYTTPNNELGFLLFHIFSRIRCCLFNFSNSPGCILVAHWGFNFHFMMTNDIEDSFKDLLDMCVPFSVKCLFKCFTHFYRIGSLLFIWSILYIPHTCPLSDKYRTNIFSQFLACLCIFKFIDLFFLQNPVVVNLSKKFFS